MANADSNIKSNNPFLSGGEIPPVQKEDPGAPLFVGCVLGAGGCFGILGDPI